MSLIEAIADDLQLGFKLDVLRVELLIRVLQQDFEVLDSLVAREQLAIGESKFALESGVLLDKLRRA